MYFLTYDGSATKSVVTSPAIPKMSQENDPNMQRPLPGKFIRPAKTAQEQIEVRRFGGYEFPAGVKVKVRDPNVVRKALCMQGFTYEGPAEVFDLPKARRVNSDDTLRIKLAELKIEFLAKQKAESKPTEQKELTPRAKRGRPPVNPVSVE